MRRKSSKRRTMHKKTSRLGRLTLRAAKTVRAKRQTNLQKARAAQKAIREKLKTLKTDFKNKLRIATEAAYQKACIQILRDSEKRSAAKQKAIAAAEAKFEKKYAKTALKTKNPNRRKKQKTMILRSKIAAKKSKQVSMTRKTKRRSSNKSK